MYIIQQLGSIIIILKTLWVVLGLAISTRQGNTDT